MSQTPCSDTTPSDLHAHWHDLVRAHYALVLPAVRALTRHAPMHVDRDELHQAGVLGLVDAARRFEQNGDVPFAAYALVRIRGAILDAMRRDDWAPRGVRADLRAFNNARDTLHHTLHREPTPTELAAALGWDTRQTLQVMHHAKRSRITALAATPFGKYDAATTPWQTPTVSPEEHVITREQRTAAVLALNYLPDDLHTVITLRFIHEWNLSRIGHLLGVTDARVAQLVREGINLLRAVLAQQRDDVPTVALNAPGAARRHAAVTAAVALGLAEREQHTVTHDVPNSSRL